MKPNVLVFFTDQQRWDSTGIHGNPMGLTPNFDRAAQEGTHLFYTSTCQPVCLPARSALQTGLYPTRTGCVTNGHHLSPGVPTLANYFNDAGYSTGYIGKWHLSNKNPVPVENRNGYQYWLAADVLEATSDAYDCKLYDGENRLVKLPGYRVDALTDAAIRFIDGNKANPFFLFCSFLEPHFQNHRDDYPAPDGYAERYLDPWTPPDLRALGGSSARHLPGYYGMVKRLDEAFGRMLDALKSLGLLENTIVLFTSDHGCHFKTRNDEYKRSGHDSSTRIPTLLTGGMFSGGGRVQRQISLVDLPPTLLDACGITVPKEMDGHSVVPLLRGAAADWPEEAFVQISESQVARAVRTKRWKYIVSAPENAPGLDAGRSDVYAEEALYDLLADPYELNNLVGFESHRKVADRMAERLVKRMALAGEKIPRILPAPSIPSGQKRVDTPEIEQ